MSRTAYDVQRDFALSCGLRTRIVWDTLGPDESDILKEKIKALVPENVQRNRQATQKMRNKLFESVWMQRKYTNHALLSTIIYVLVTEERDNNAAKNSSEFSCHPIFRTFKCFNSDNRHDGCMIFIDDSGRVYRNWKHFLETNVLPKGTMIAPKNGIYLFNDEDEMELEFHLTPAARPKKRILSTTDTVATVGGFAAAIPMTAAIAFPIATPIMAAATAVTLTTAAYTTVRSAMQLTDRGIHEQSISLADREARGNWLGIASGTIGIGASGATKALSYATTAGRQISLGAKVVVNGMNVSSILLSGSGVANSVYDIYMKIQDNDTITKIDVLQLSASLIVFTHSVNNFKLALNASKNNSSGTSLRTQIAKQMRDLLNKISSDTLTRNNSSSNNGAINNSFDIIRIVNNIPFKEVLFDLHTQNPNLVPQTLVANGFIKALNALMSKIASGINDDYIFTLAEQLGFQFVQHIVNMNSMMDIINAMSKYFSESVIRLFLNLTRTFIDEFNNDFDTNLRTFVSTESVLYTMLMYCIKNYAQFTLDFLESNTCKILNAVEEYFKSVMPCSANTERKKCKECNGYFFVCDL